MRRGTRQLLMLVVIPIISLMTVAIVFMALGHPNAAWVVGNLGTLGVMIVAVAYVVAFDSRRCWPGASWFERLTRLLTFQR